MVVNNIHNDPITVGCCAGLGLLHHPVAARVEADSAPSGALDLDMGAIQVSGVDEGAEREYLKRCNWMREVHTHLPPMKGTKELDFPSRRHWGRALQITSGLAKSSFMGNSTVLRGDTTWGRQPDQ